MATEVKLPELGDGIESGDVLEVFVSVGDVINEGQDIIEMETDKATVPVPSSVAGTVTKILVGEGDTVPIGGALLEVDAAEAAATPQAAPVEATPVEATPEPAAPVPAAPVPAAPEPAAPEPAAPEPAAPAEPVASVASAATAPAPAVAPAANLPASAGVIPAGPAVRRFAREVGVDLSGVAGSGERGRITREDVLSVVRSANQTARGAAASATSQTAKAEASGTQSATASAPVASAESSVADLPGTVDQDDFGPIRVERMSKIRKTIARQMHTSWSTVPRVTNFDDADITDLEHLRQTSKEDYAAQGLKLTTMPFLIKAVATALRHHPVINGVMDEANEQVIYKDYVNVGIAVDTERGLVVPVMPNADKMGVPEVTRSLAEMAGKVRGGNFSVGDLRGGTFTISNLGAIGGQYSTPIVNVPEVAILLVGRSRKLPVVMPDDTIQPRLMMPLSLSYDHRMVDGGTAARFLNDVIGYLEAPSRLLLAL
ncbi:MAG: 2-oxo acid dehydrogenase subunit E2 [Rubripirellula sp.]|nr:2-oxo acid dehydrogenase subunit E2 [Rubripirellula sp.]